MSSKVERSVGDEDRGRAGVTQTRAQDREGITSAMPKHSFIRPVRGRRKPLNGSPRHGGTRRSHAAPDQIRLLRLRKVAALSVFEINKGLALLWVFVSA